MVGRVILRGDAGGSVVLVDGAQVELGPGESEPPEGALYRFHAAPDGGPCFHRAPDPRDGTADEPAIAEGKP